MYEHGYNFYPLTIAKLIAPSVLILTQPASGGRQPCPGCIVSCLIGAWSKPLLGITDPLIAESMALREGVLFARLRGISRVIMETDCMEVVNLWKTRHNSRCIVAPLLEEIGELASSFISFDIQHVIRTSNYPAHLCAKRASTLNVTESWMDETPSFLFSCLLADCPASAYV
jgi:hypothetical protein